MTSSHSATDINEELPAETEKPLKEILEQLVGKVATKEDVERLEQRIFAELTEIKSEVSTLVWRTSVTVAFLFITIFKIFI